MVKKVESKVVDTADRVKEVAKEESKAIYIGTATTDLNTLKKGEKVKVLEDKDDQWLTEKGLVSKLFLLLEKI